MQYIISRYYNSNINIALCEVIFNIMYEVTELMGNYTLSQSLVALNSPLSHNTSQIMYHKTFILKLFETLAKKVLSSTENHREQELLLGK